MSPDGTAATPTLTAPHREIKGGDVTHEYMLPQVMESYYEKMSDSARIAIASQVRAAKSGADMFRIFQDSLTSTTSMTPPHLAPLLQMWQTMVGAGNQFIHTTLDAMHNATNDFSDFQDSLSEEMFDHMSRASFRQLYAQNQLKETLSTYSASLYPQGDDSPVNTLIEKNGAFFEFAHPSSGSEMRELDAENNPDDMNPLRWFPPGKPDEWPVLALMSNTSAARDMDDIAVIAHGIENLYYAAHNDAPERPIKVISTLHTRENSLANGEVIAERIENIQRDHKERALKRDDYHMHRRNLEGITPDVVRLGNLFLSCLLENPSQIDVNATHEGKLEDGGKLPSIRSNSEDTSPLKLRHDYLEVARHIRFSGYSRGGNVATDAWRYAARQLVGNTNQTIGLQPLEFEKHDGNILKEEEAKTLLNAAGVLSIAAWETPASDLERELGLNRVSLVNQNDHLIDEFVKFHGGYEKYIEDDQLFVVKGARGNIAHAPKPALIGHEGALGYFTDPTNPRMNECKKQDGSCARSIPDALKDFFSVEPKMRTRSETVQADPPSDIADSIIHADSITHEAQRVSNAFAPSL